jgi:hypothetical protein
LSLPNLTMVQNPHAYSRNPCRTHCAKSWKPLGYGTCQAQAFVPIHAHSEFWCPFGNFGSPYQAPANSSWAQWHEALFYLFLVPLQRHKGESSWVYLTSVGATWLLCKSMKTIMEWNVLGAGHCAPCATRLTQIPRRHTPSPYYIWLHECFGCKDFKPLFLDKTQRQTHQMESLQRRNKNWFFSHSLKSLIEWQFCRA